MFAIETAMRQGELARARREHVDKAKRVIYVPKSKMDWLTGNKGKAVPLSSRAMEIIDSLRVSFIDGSLFGMTQEQIKKGWIRLSRNEKLEDLRFHDLCHEATSRLFEAGFSIAEVSAITGKKDWRTLERYTHPDAEKLAQRMR
jgi:integrase